MRRSRLKLDLSARTQPDPLDDETDRNPSHNPNHNRDFGSSELGL